MVQKGGFPIRYCPTHKGKVLQYSEPKEVHMFDGKPHLLEKTLRADYAFIKGHIGDEEGNVMFKQTAFNFNKDMAQAARTTICEVEHLVPAGQLAPEDIHLPGIYVSRIFEGKNYKKTLEMPTFVNDDGTMDLPWGPEEAKVRKTIAA